MTDEQIPCECGGAVHCPYLGNELEQLRKIGPQHQAFLDLTDETYDGCTREQKLGVYIQHRPANVVAFLLELLELSHPEPKDPTDGHSEPA